MIAIVDYGAGNLRSVFNAFEAIGHSAEITDDPKTIQKADAIVLPGVGAFGDGMERLGERNMLDVLNEAVLVQKKPYLGICLGLQYLAEESLENGQHKGFGWIKGDVVPIQSTSPGFRVPHMGWNNVDVHRECPLFRDLEDGPIFYFVHSYHFKVENASSQVITSTCDHGETVTASIHHENIWGVQFHPEKSQRSGLKLLENFTRLI